MVALGSITGTALACCIGLSVVSLVCGSRPAGTPLLESQAAVVGGFLAIFSAFAVLVMQSSITAYAPHLLGRLGSDRPALLAIGYLLFTVLWDFFFIAVGPTRLVLWAAFSLAVGTTSILVLLLWRSLLMLDVTRFTALESAELAELVRAAETEPNLLRAVAPADADRYAEGVMGLIGIARAAAQRDDHRTTRRILDQLTDLGRDVVACYEIIPSVRDEPSALLAQELEKLGRLGVETERTWLAARCTDALLALGVAQARLPLGPPDSPLRVMTGSGEGGTGEPWTNALTILAADSPVGSGAPQHCMHALGELGAELTRNGYHLSAIPIVGLIAGPARDARASLTDTAARAIVRIGEAASAQSQPGATPSLCQECGATLSSLASEWRSAREAMPARSVPEEGGRLQLFSQPVAMDPSPRLERALAQSLTVVPEARRWAAIVASFIVPTIELIGTSKDAGTVTWVSGRAKYWLMLLVHGLRDDRTRGASDLLASTVRALFAAYCAQLAPLARLAAGESTVAAAPPRADQGIQWAWTRDLPTTLASVHLSNLASLTWLLAYDAHDPRSELARDDVVASLAALDAVTNENGPFDRRQIDRLVLGRAALAPAGPREQEVNPPPDRDLIEDFWAHGDYIAIVTRWVLGGGEQLLERDFKLITEHWASQEP